MSGAALHTRWFVPRISAMLVAVATVAPADSLAPHTMARIPATKLRLGTDLNGVIRATEECSRARGSRPCEPEEFAAEINDGAPQMVQTFWLDRREVSRAAFQQCVRAGQCSPLQESLLPPSFIAPDLPAVNLSQIEAERYCQFRGARLPTEAEFEVAARGLRARRYPWGNLDNTHRANGGTSTRALSSREDGYSLLAPTTAYRAGKSPQGILQLSGNVAEWTSSEFSPHGSSGRSGLVVVKGGSFAMPRIALRATSRRAERNGSRHPDVGFRCAKSSVSSTKSPPSSDQ